MGEKGLFEAFLAQNTLISTGKAARKTRILRRFGKHLHRNRPAPASISLKIDPFRNGDRKMTRIESRDSGADFGGVFLKGDFRVSSIIQWDLDPIRVASLRSCQNAPRHSQLIAVE